MNNDEIPNKYVGENVTDLSDREIISMLAQEHNKVALTLSAITLAIEAILNHFPQIEVDLAELYDTVYDDKSKGVH